MNAEFDWWLLLIGAVAGAGLVWLIVADARRRDDELADDERRLEVDWIAEAFDEAGRPVQPHTIEAILRLHRAYLAGPAPELDPVEQATDQATAEADDQPAEADRADEGRAGIREQLTTGPAPAPGGPRPRQAPGDGS
ncbi:MAG TPA: hypothetical protein VIV06_12270 [Candidatus Limnocylindrales bacterium]